MKVLTEFYCPFDGNLESNPITIILGVEVSRGGGGGGVKEDLLTNLTFKIKFQK